MSTEGSNVEVRRLIEAAVQQFVAAFNRGDTAAIAQLYAQDGQILPPQSEPITGRSGIQAFWQGAMDMGVKAAKLEPVEIEGHGTTAVEVGRFELYAAGQQRVDKGKYIVVWKLTQGEWKLWRDIWNTSLSPSA
jgi:uncharacterized protein (TIGR02246 family)